MSWNTPTMLRRVRSLPSHLNELGINLTVLSRETQQKIAETVAETIAQIARDGLYRFWCGADPNRPMLQERSHVSNPWEDPMGSESWDFPGEMEIERDFSELVQQPPAPSSSVFPPVHVMALSLKVAAWYLLRRGSLVSALGLGALAGGVALIGGKVVMTGFDLLQSASELAALNDSLARISHQSSCARASDLT